VRVEIDVAGTIYVSCLLLDADEVDATGLLVVDGLSFFAHLACLLF
jgi:hypothetical protein